MQAKLLVAIAILAAAAPSAADTPREISWDELIPASSGGWPAAPDTDTSDASSPVPFGGVVGELNGQAVRIPGFIVPLESDEGGLLAEFFLVPYFGACIHVPPPPANQIVYVRTAQAYALNRLFDAVWVSGTIRTAAHLNEVGDAGYTLDATRIEPYED